MAISLAFALLAAGSAPAQQPGRPAVAGRTVSLPAVVPSPPTPMPIAQSQEPKVAKRPEYRPQLPTRQQVFGIMYDDAALEKAILKQVADYLAKNKQPGAKAEPGQFPPLVPVVPAGTPYIAKTVDYPPRFAVMEPGFVVHRRLHFEQKNAERYAWDLGFIQPFVSAATFYKDMLLWPNSLATGAVVGFWDTSAGKCLPGSPTPYYLYPQGLTITGTAFEAAVVTGVSFIIP